MRKKNNVCMKKPYAVGQPPSDAIGMSLPNRRCVSLKVSGFATRKKTRAE
jgi:hypothetical protein